MTTTPLVPVFTGQLQNQTTQLCNARDLHQSLQVGRDFSNWIKGRIEEYGFIEGEDFAIDSPKRANQTGRGGDRRSRDYHLTLDMAKELAMIENNEIGRQVRRYFIQCERAAVLPAPTSDEILTPSEAQTLHEVIDRKAAGCGTWKAKAYPEIYTRLQNKFRANSYKLIRRSQLADAILYVTEMELHGAPKALPARIPVRKMGDLSFFSKSGRKGSPYHGPDSFSNWWDYPQHLKQLPWAEGLKVGRGFFAEVAELAEHDEQAAYIVLESVLGIAWSLPAGNPQKNSCIEYGFAQAMAVAMMTGLRAMRGGATAYAWGV